MPSATPEATAKFVPVPVTGARPAGTGCRAACRRAGAGRRSSPRLLAQLGRQDVADAAWTSPWRRRITSAIRPVQPVWWKAPIAAPLSPWKYSLKIRLSCQAGSVCSSSVPPKQGRRPSGPRVKIEISRSRQVGGDLVQGQLLARPGRVLDGEVVAEEPVVALQRR